MSGNTPSIIVLGGTSDIGRATALRYAQQGWQVHLAGRDLARLQREADDIAGRTGVLAITHRLDILDTVSFRAFVDDLSPLPQVAVCVVGLLGDQSRAQTDVDHAAAIMRSNYEGPALLLDMIASRFLERGFGTLVGVSSVAGDRGRASNYVYGSAKAGLTAFLSGLRNRLAKTGVHVITVKPGFVRTRMTAGMTLPAALTASPEEVAEAILRAERTGRNQLYVKPIWRFIMAVIKSIPEFVFKKMKL